jgi:CelD/BcsL family acetyltransferase involved in cellulose biosynthesis
MISTHWVKGELIETLDSVAVDPRHLLNARDSSSLFERMDWFTETLPVLPDEATPLVVRAWGEIGQCWLFLASMPSRRATALASWYSFAFRPVFRNVAERGQQESLLIAIARRLRRARNSPVEITLAPVPRKDGTSKLIRSAFAKAGWTSLRHQSSTSWTIAVDGKSFDTFWQERPGQLRNTHDRKLKKYGVETEILTTFDNDAWAAYESVYAESWKPREGDARFLRRMAEREGKAGCLRLGLARLDGEVVAAQFWTVENGIAYIHKLAHREAARQSSAGTILSAALFRHVIDTDRVSLIDFGTGNDRYKADWMDRNAPLDTIRLYNTRHPAGLGRYLKARISALVHNRQVD